MALEDTDLATLSIQERHDLLWAEIRQLRHQVRATLRRAELAERERDELLERCADQARAIEQLQATNEGLADTLTAATEEGV